MMWTDSCSRLSTIKAALFTTYEQITHFDDAHAKKSLSLDAQVVFLPNVHHNPAHFEHQVSVINQFYNPASDILIIEAPEGSDHFEEKRARFAAACKKTVEVAGWVEEATFNQVTVLTGFYEAVQVIKDPAKADTETVEKARRILKQALPQFECESELIAKSVEFIESAQVWGHIFTCLTGYQTALISKINEYCRSGKRVFVDVGLLHVDERIAVAEGYENFLPQISRLKTSLVGKRVTYLYPPPS